MKCPFCNSDKTRVLDKRELSNGFVVRRRRECMVCGRRFTTYERIELPPIVVIKKDGSREMFDRNKILRGIMKACEKRNISLDKMQEVTQEVESEIRDKFDQEIQSKVIGELVANKLKDLDYVAYIRFASVYKEFKDIEEFEKELKELKKQKIEVKKNKR